jgi:small toxic polypeptide LdrA/B/C/D
MTYGTLALTLVALAAVLAVVGALALPRARRSGHLLAVLATASGLVLLTAVFDTVMIHFDLFSYASDKIGGIAIGLAPIEDFSYPIACALALPAVWVLMRRRRGDD